MKAAVIATSLLCAAAVVTLGAQAHPMRPGRWEITASMQMGTMSMPPMTNTQCITAEELKRSNEGGMPAGWATGPQSNCKVSDYTLAGDTVTWKMECSGPRASTGQGRMVFKGDTYDGTMSMTMPQGEMTMKTTGKRVGDCTK